MLLADGAVEDVDSVLVHTPAQTVGGGAVVAALTTGLRHRKPSLQPSLVLLCRHQLTRKLLIILYRLDYQSSASLHTKSSSYRCRIIVLSRQLKRTFARMAVQQNKSCLCVTHSSDLSLLQQAGTGVGLISIGTRHLRLFTQHDDWT